MAHAGYLDHLLAANAHLRSKIYSRSVAVDHELDQLRALRAGLALAVVGNRKRRRGSDHVSIPAPAAPQRPPSGSVSPALLAALQAEVEARARDRGTSPVGYDKETWTDIATSLRVAGHPHCCTPYRLWNAFARVHYARTAFTPAEAQALCQLVQERGYDWAAVGKAIQQRFGRERSPFDLAQHYRSHMRCAFVQNRLAPSQLLALLDCSAIGPHCHDYDAVSVEARRFTKNRSLQVDPRYLQKQIQALVFSRDVPHRHHLYWKMMNLMCQLPLSVPYRLDAMHHTMSLCYRQCSLPELSQHLECTVAALKAKVVEHLLRLSWSLETLNSEECSRLLFGNASAARAIFQVAEELYERGASNG